jgi:hypothetical protein
LIGVAAAAAAKKADASRVAEVDLVGMRVEMWVRVMVSMRVVVPIG